MSRPPLASPDHPPQGELDDLSRELPYLSFHRTGSVTARPVEHGQAHSGDERVEFSHHGMKCAPN